MLYPNIDAIFGVDENIFKDDVRYTECDFIDAFSNEKTIPKMEIALAPNFNPNLIDSFKTNLEKQGYVKELHKSALDERI